MSSQRKTILGPLVGFLAVVCPLAGGCRAPSLLITPVPGHRELVETQLSRDGILARDKIAMLDVTGTIRNTAPIDFLLPTENPVSELLEQLDKAARDPRVKAVILRINSPGGTVVASELMYDEIMRFRQTTGKPVVAMMMDVAASGGYYIACACDSITAQPSTITGSIGVIMLNVDLTGTLAKIGARADAIVSGPHKDAGSPFRSLSPQERALFQGIVDDMYGRFVTVVANARPKLSAERVRDLADGRVFTATQAVEQGLIDRIASPRETIELVKQMAGLGQVRLVAYSRPHEFRPNYYASHAAPPAGDINLLKIDLPSAVLANPPEFLYLWSPGR